MKHPKHSHEGEQKALPDLPPELHRSIYDFVPATGMRLSKQYEKNSAQRMEKVCPRDQQPVYLAENKKWYCPLHPRLPPVKSWPSQDLRCCLPPLLADDKDLAQVWSVIEQLGRFTWIHMDPRTLQETARGVFFAPGSAERSKKLFSDLALHMRAGQVVGLRGSLPDLTGYSFYYERDPETGLLRLQWPDSTFHYLLYLISSDLPEDSIVGEMTSNRDLRRMHGGDIRALASEAKTQGKPKVESFLTSRFPRE